ncbi:MAG: hypothetical protein AW12_02525 [Candidatus Accumulibacter sp. BA-94]|nr:MAG: hypothetical protein AW12_02525 [Candidatus Accumulibacter sp. BA-94]
MLHAVAELAEHLVGDVERVLADEVDADSLRADQPHHLFDLLEQRRRRLVEEQMRLVEEEDELGLVDVTDFGQLLEQLGEQPEQEGRIEARRSHQPVAGQDVDDAAAIVGLHQVADVEHRLAEEQVTTVLAEVQQPALDGTDRSRRDVAVLGGEVLRVLADMLHHRPQVLEVEEQQPVVVGNAEDQLQHAGLRVIEIQQPGQQHRSHVRDRRAYRMPLLAENVPVDDRAARRYVILDAERVEPGLQLRRQAAGSGQPRQIPLDVGHEHRHANARKAFGEQLQGDRLAGSGGAGDQSVAVGECRQQRQLGAFVAGDEER